MPKLECTILGTINLNWFVEIQGCKFRFNNSVSFNTSIYHVHLSFVAEEVTDEISANVNDDGYYSDSGDGDGSAMEVVDMSHINMTTNETTEELEPCVVCL